MRRGLLPGALILLLLCYSLGSQAATPGLHAQRPKEPPAAKKNSIEQELKQLRDVFGNSEVAVFSTGYGPVEGRISGLVEVFGKRFLQITTNQGKQHLVKTDIIVSIRQN